VQEDERALVGVAGVLHGFEAPPVDPEVEIDTCAHVASPEDDAGASATPR
jgi:hypothetical protein